MSKVLFIFPGQGSQTVGMGKDFFDNYDIAKQMVEDASKRLDIDFKALLFEENDKLGQTQYTQAAILLVSCIALAIFKENNKIRIVRDRSFSKIKNSKIKPTMPIKIINYPLVYKAIINIRSTSTNNDSYR